MTWRGKKETVTCTDRAGESAPGGSFWRQLPLLLDAHQPGTLQKQPLRSSYLWVRLRSLSSYSRLCVTERAFVSWLTLELAAAEFGALSLEWVKVSARAELDILDDDLFRWLTRNCVGQGRFKSDGTLVRLRGVGED